MQKEKLPQYRVVVDHAVLVEKEWYQNVVLWLILNLLELIVAEKHTD